jgi:DNA-binding MarR family transcriptional regulator
MPVRDDSLAVPSDGHGRPLAPLSSAIFLLARAHRAYAAELLRRHGLHPGQELVLMQLHERGSQTQAALLDAVGLDHSTLSRSLSRMESAGLVQRSPSAMDRRAAVVSLTPKGKRLRKPLLELWQELERTTTDGVAPEALDDLVRSLHAVRRAVVERASGEGVADLQRRSTAPRRARQAAAAKDG